MSPLFSPYVLNGLVLANRLVRSATWEGMCDEAGAPTPRLEACYTGLAQGGVGLIISGYAYVLPEGKQLPGKMGMHSEALAPAMMRLTSRVHEAGGKICAQIVHAGGQTTTAMIGRPPLAPSAVPQFTELPEELSTEEIGRVVQAFGEAARRVRAWGFDAVQIHGAHGYLVHQFLSPLTNRREDAYGGTPEKRRRFLEEVYGAVRGAVGDGFPVLIKLNGADFLPGGLELEESILAARWLDRAGIDAIEVSGGTPASGEYGPARSRAKTPGEEGYHLPLTRALRTAVGCPLLVVGGIRSLEMAEGIVAEGVADGVSLARPLIREPDLPSRWRSGDRAPSQCRSCNGCFKPGLKEGGIYCVKQREEAADAPSP